MMNDLFGASHTSTSQAAVHHYNSAVMAIGAHRPLGTALQDVIANDPGFVAAYALLGFANIILGRAETQAAGIHFSRVAARALKDRDGGTPPERTLVRALDLAAQGHLRTAADVLEGHLKTHPIDFTALKIAHSLRFMSGQPAEMLALTRRVLPHWRKENGGYGFVLGCHAFALEEGGNFGEAEERGRQAYAHEASDAWGLHAVSHVMEMSNRTAEGIQWLSDSRHDWKLCNNFAFHIGWHLALFYLDRGEVERVLDLYDQDIRSAQTDDFRDLANASSLLWRLSQYGVDVGDRWAALHDIASRRREDTTYVFGSLHYLLVLVARRDKRGAAELIAALRHRARGRDDQAHIAATIGVPLAEVLAGLGETLRERTDLVDLAARLQCLGGSHAQRDVFLQSLLVRAYRLGDNAGIVALSRIRHRLRRSDNFIRTIDRPCGAIVQSARFGSAA